MKALLLFVFAISSGVAVQAQAPSPAQVELDIANHFTSYPAERFRYTGLAKYGIPQTVFESAQIEAELKLYNLVKNSALIQTPTKNVFALCHNLLIHSPEEGKQFLKELNNPTNNEAILGLLFIELMFAGEYGEQLALDNLESPMEGWSVIWSTYLGSFAIYESSVPRIEAVLKQTNNVAVKQNLTDALMYIGSPKSIETIKHIIDTTAHDALQAKAIFALAELSGFDGIGYLQSIKTTGEKSEKERKSSVDWLKKETSASNKFGTEVTSDMGFINRFANISSPAMVWLKEAGQLNENYVNNPKALGEEEKAKLIDLLIESRGFGLEAAKGQLFLSIRPTDFNKLLSLRQACLYSPNEFTKGQLKTIGIFIRSLRKQK
jgi:hypothetical protein